MIYRLSVGWLVVLRINVDLAIFQPYLDLEAGDNQSLKIQVARPGIEPRSSCSASQELNHSATAAPYIAYQNAETNRRTYYLHMEFRFPQFWWRFQIIASIYSCRYWVYEIRKLVLVIFFIARRKEVLVDFTRRNWWPLSISTRLFCV